MAQETDKIILPPKYYLDYFHYLLSFLEEHYAHVLGAPEIRFINDFKGLSEPAQCLFVRFSNRKGPWYRLSKIAYEEIPDTEAAAQELLANEFIDDQAENSYEFFNLFTRKELEKILGNYLQEFKHEKKIFWIEHLIAEESAFSLLADAEPIVRVGKQLEFEFLKMLFFGSYKSQMTEFVIRDVGHVKLQDLDAKKFKPWCQSREEAMAFFEVSELKSGIRRAMQEYPAITIHASLHEIDWQQFTKFPHARKALAKISHEIGQQLERENAKQEALFYYALVDAPPSRERRVRILDQLDRKEEATALAEEILLDHKNAGERVFAKDFLERKNIRIDRSMSKKLKLAPVLSLEQNPEIRVEALAIHHFEQEGFEAIHAENFLWRNMFGLVFWEQLFDQSQDSFHHPLQRIPADIYNGFYENRREQLHATAATLTTRKRLQQKLASVINEKNGLANPFIYWYPDLLPHLSVLVEKLKPGQLMSILLEMSKNPKDNATGFPDLFIWNNDSYHFYEIKSPNDHLSAQQLFWIELMQTLGIKADILRVEYR